MALSASFSFSISTNANPRERPVSRSVMIRALLTAPYRSNKLRTASSVALKLRLPTKIFFTLTSSRQFESGLIGEGTEAERQCQQAHRRAQKHSAGLAEAIKRNSTIPRVFWGHNREAKKRGGEKNKKPPEKPGAFFFKPGKFLLSHTVACAVPSGLRSLTSVFGMGTGGSSSLRSPRN